MGLATWGAVEVADGTAVSILGVVFRWRRVMAVENGASVDGVGA